MGADQDVRLLQDRVLADRARHRSRAAFDELYRRHAPSSWRLAHAMVGRDEAAEAAVANAFATTLATGPADLGSAGHRTRIVLLGATRRAAIDAAASATDAPVEPAGLEAEATRVRVAFDALPERWRSALWLVDVESCPAADAMRVVGLEPDGDPRSLVERARLGLREAVLHSGVGPATPAGCRRTVARLSDYSDARLVARDEARVRAHLDRCAACRERLANLDDIVIALRTTAAPLPATLAAVAGEQWSASLVRRRGPLHLVLPSGEPVPVWAQRALAGTAAAIIALGITGATLLSGRGGRAKSDAVSPLSGEGESASAGAAHDLTPLVLDGSGFPTLSLGAAPGAARSALPAEIARSAGAPSPSAGRAAPAGEALPRSGSSTTPPASPPPTPPPSTDSGAVTVGVDGVAEVTVGESCLGAELLGEPIGCEAPASEDPVAADSEGGPLGL